MLQRWLSTELDRHEQPGFAALNEQRDVILRARNDGLQLIGAANGLAVSGQHDIAGADWDARL